MNMLKNSGQYKRLLPESLESLLGTDDIQYARKAAGIGDRQARNILAGRSGTNFKFLSALMERAKVHEQLMNEVIQMEQRLKGMQSNTNNNAS
jgi:Holliday junction resolvasome RuvABC DNA-binding subunit